MKSLSRALGVLSLLAAITAVVVPLVAMAVFLRTDSPVAVFQSSLTSLLVAGVGVALGVGGYAAGRRYRSTAWPVIGGLTSICVVVGLLVTRAFI